jgi:hypothetical protein
MLINAYCSSWLVLCLRELDCSNFQLLMLWTLVEILIRKLLNTGNSGPLILIQSGIPLLLQQSENDWNVERVTQMTATTTTTKRDTRASGAGWLQITWYTLTVCAGTIQFQHPHTEESIVFACFLSLQYDKQALCAILLCIISTGAGIAGGNDRSSPSRRLSQQSRCCVSLVWPPRALPRTKVLGLSNGNSLRFHFMPKQ